MNSSEVLARMLNSWSSTWDITDERLEALFSLGGLATPQYQAVLLPMLSEAKSEKKSWEATAERILAVRSAIVGSCHPTSSGLQSIIRQVRLGAMQDGVSDKPWVEAALRVLERISKLTP
jgi:hypothetical protein